MISELGPDFYDSVVAAEFPETILRYRNDAAAKSVGVQGLSDEKWVAHFGEFKPLKDNLSEPLALRYHGHQFQHYNPDLGDGRGFLFAQIRDDKKRLMDLGTKGSGQTPYSRQGDGRLTLLGGVREVLATNYLQYLGVNTSKSFSLIETGESLHRNDEPSPTRSAVLVRLSHSHIRFGTFQRLAFLEERDNLEKLADYCIRHFYTDATNSAELLELVTKNSADTVASWMAGGFVHGVMNTDNMNITGETFDYGPYRFLPTLKSGYTAAYFDRNGLYAFARQPQIMYWNLGQLANSLALIHDDKALISALEGYADHYRLALRDHVFRRFGIAPTELDVDVDFVLETFKYLEDSQAGWPQFWFDWQGGAEANKVALKSPNKEFYKGDQFDDWFKTLRDYESLELSRQSYASLLYDEIGALWEPIAELDNWTDFETKVRSFSIG